MDGRGLNTAPSQGMPAGDITPRPVSAGRGRKALVIVASVAAVLAVAGWVLAYFWFDRAQTAEDEYRFLEDAFALSSDDVSSLEDRQRELAEEKAAIEDEKTVLEVQQAELEAEQLELASVLDTVSQIANLFSSCSEGYSKVIADLTTGNVTAQTQEIARRADADCARGNALVRTL